MDHNEKTIKISNTFDNEFLNNLIANNYPHILSTFNNNTSLEVILNTVFSYYENITACMPGIVYWFDRNCKAVGCNDNQLKMLGFSSMSQFKGLTFEEIGIINNWSFEVIQKFKSDTIEVLTSGKAKLNVEEPPVYDKNGDVKYYLTSRVPVFDLSNNVLAVVGISIDITDRKLAEKELLIAKEKAEEANKLKLQFIENMQHDIRTPLSGIYMFMLQAAEKELDSDPDKKMYYQTMAASVGQLLNLCNEIIDFENIEYLGSEVNFQVVDARKFFSRPIDLEKVTALSKGIDLHLEINEEVPEYLKLDKIRVERILINLIGNALKFTDEGSITLKVSAENTPNATKIKLDVIDTGMGIPEDKINSIFDKFVRLNPSNRGIYKGSGLGLSYVKKFVNDMGGKLSVVSEMGKGTTFSVTLNFPLLEEGESPNYGEHEIDTSTFSSIQIPEVKKKVEKELNQPVVLNKSSILLIEDDLILQNVIKNMLQSLGCQVSTAPGVATGNMLIGQTKYDLVICDLGLIDGTGFDVIDWVKLEKNHPNQQTPFIVLTANHDDNKRQEALKKGFLEVLQKPLSFDKAKALYEKYILNGIDARIGNTMPLNNDADIYDFDAIVETMQDKALSKKILIMLKDSLQEEVRELRNLCEKNDIKATRELLHRLKGSLEYAFAHRLLRSRETLHDAVRQASQLSTLKPLYDDFSKEVEIFIQAVDGDKTL